MAGKNLTNNKNKVKNNPKLPIKVQTSTQVGENIAQLEGK
jgi:uncharacterized protein YjlB